MTEGYRPLPGVYGPREIEAMVGAYRALLREICDDGSLAEIARSSLPAREIRRLAARQIIVVSAIGIKDPQELLSQAVSRLAGKAPAAAVG